jgi:hypothetical protein
VTAVHALRKSTIRPPGPNSAAEKIALPGEKKIVCSLAGATLRQEFKNFPRHLHQARFAVLRFAWIQMQAALEEVCMSHSTAKQLALSPTIGVTHHIARSHNPTAAVSRASNSYSSSFTNAAHIYSARPTWSTPQTLLTFAIVFGWDCYVILQPGVQSPDLWATKEIPARQHSSLTRHNFLWAHF